MGLPGQGVQSADEQPVLVDLRLMLGPVEFIDGLRNDAGRHVRVIVR